MNSEPAVETVPGAGGPSQDLSDRPEWFDRVFTGDGGPPRLPDEPDRHRWEPSGDVRSAVYFLLGLCCGLLTAYLIYHVGGR
jgi:hypothetical protein